MFFLVMSFFGSLMPKNIMKPEVGNMSKFFSLPLFSFVFLSLASYCLKKISDGASKTPTSIIAVVSVFMFFGSIVSEFGQTYNYFVQTNEELNKSVDDISLLYQKKANLVGNVGDTKKSYTKYERDIIDRILQSRKHLLKATAIHDKIASIEKLDKVMNQSLINIENYPNLKA